MASHRHHYGLSIIILHWLSALWVVALFASGYWMVTLTYYDPLYRVVPFYHKSFGILFFALLILRVSVRVAQKNTQPAPPDLKAWQNRAARWGHRALYLGMLCVPLLGYGISTADGRAISVFDVFEIPALPWRWANQEVTMGWWHEWGAYALMTLAAGHAMMALVHGRLILSRMLPWVSQRPASESDDTDTKFL